MDEKKKNTEGKKLNVNDKLTWEAPELYCLDKGKTEGGVTFPVTKEDTSYQDS